jgi:hypothetical protein
VSNHKLQNWTSMFGYLRVAAFTAAVLGTSSAVAVDLTQITHFGTGMYGVCASPGKGAQSRRSRPDVTGFITSRVARRFKRAGLDIPYGEGARAITAIQQGVN